MTSDGTFPQRLTKVDELTRPNHWRLTDADVCYFIGEYTADRRYDHSDTNQLISNFKKPMDRRGRRLEWHYKEQAIRKAAEAFRRALAPEYLDRWTFVPIPPSKAKGDPLYDDRLTRMLGAIRPSPPLDIREVIVQTESTAASHRDERPAPEQIQALYRIDETLTEPAPGIFAVVDDILTTGTHFRAAKSVLSTHFPGTSIIGLFIARRVPLDAAADFEDFDDGDF